jgi:hypothetical protein
MSLFESFTPFNTIFISAVSGHLSKAKIAKNRVLKSG